MDELGEVGERDARAEVVDLVLLRFLQTLEHPHAPGQPIRLEAEQLVVEQGVALEEVAGAGESLGDGVDRLGLRGHVHLPFVSPPPQMSARGAPA